MHVRQRKSSPYVCRNSVLAAESIKEARKPKTWVAGFLVKSELRYVARLRNSGKVTVTITVTVTVGAYFTYKDLFSTQ